MATQTRPVPVRLGSDTAMVQALRQGDEETFHFLVSSYHAGLVRLAMIHVGSRATAEEVAMQTWRAVLDGLADFDGDGSLRTWIFGILESTARARAAHQARLAPAPVTVGASQAHPRAGRTAAEVTLLIQDVIEALPPVHRAVILLRDVERWPADEVGAKLRLSPVAQRRLLHRARCRVHAALDGWFLQCRPLTG
jgi:RNA polymerase sigma-70 factor, ECF subfamily